VSYESFLSFQYYNTLRRLFFIWKCSFAGYMGRAYGKTCVVMAMSSATRESLFVKQRSRAQQTCMTGVFFFIHFDENTSGSEKNRRECDRTL
jgi:hypothetical protein